MKINIEYFDLRINIQYSYTHATGKKLSTDYTTRHQTAARGPHSAPLNR